MGKLNDLRAQKRELERAMVDYNFRGANNTAEQVEEFDRLSAQLDKVLDEVLLEDDLEDLSACEDGSLPCAECGCPLTPDQTDGLCYFHRGD